MNEYEDFIGLTLEQMKGKVKQSIEDNKPLHDMASIGISPKDMGMYVESIKIINEYKTKSGLKKV